VFVPIDMPDAASTGYAVIPAHMIAVN